MIHGADTGFLVAVELEEDPDHDWARKTMARIVANGDYFGVAPQVLTEFVHVVTDQRRFQQPIAMVTALDLAERWWHARETIPLAPADFAVQSFLAWMRRFNLGRKRVLDTMLASTLKQEGISSIITTNAHDFETLGEFTCISPGKDNSNTAVGGV